MSTTAPYVIAQNSAGLPNQDYFCLGGGQAGSVAVSPGKCVVSGLNRPQGWDVRKGYALSGATVVPTGSNLSKFSVIVTVWAGAQYSEWKDFSNTYLTRAAVLVSGTVTPKALSIVHPVVNDPPYSITEVVVEDVVALRENDDGIYEFEIHFLEYRKPLPAIGKPAAATPVAANPVPSASDKALAAANARAAAYRAAHPATP
jgi:hypothetical protein